MGMRLDGAVSTFPLCQSSGQRSGWPTGVACIPYSDSLQIEKIMPLKTENASGEACYRVHRWPSDRGPVGRCDMMTRHDLARAGANAY